MSEAPERIWDFWPHDGGSPVLWREPCPFPAEDAEVFEYVRADRIEELETQLSEARQVGKEWFEEQKKARKDANAAEAKLAKAVEDLEFIALNFNKPNAGLSAFGERQHYLFVACRLRDKARTTLAELSSVSCANTTGDKDE